MSKKRVKKSTIKKDKLPKINDMDSDNSVNYYDEIDKNDQHEFISINKNKNIVNDEFLPIEELASDSEYSLIDGSGNDNVSGLSEDDAKAWGNDVRNFYSTERHRSKSKNKSDEDEDDDELEYKEAENYRKRLNNYLSESDFNLNVFNALIVPSSKTNKSLLNESFGDLEENENNHINEGFSDAYIEELLKKYNLELSNLLNVESHNRFSEIYKKNIEHFINQLRIYQINKTKDYFTTLKSDLKSLQVLELSKTVLFPRIHKIEEEISDDSNISENVSSDNMDDELDKMSSKVLEYDFHDKSNKRPINYMIEKNKLLFKKSKKSLRNPRVKNKLKYKKALKKHNKNVKPYITEKKRYNGEKGGIRKNVIHSVKLN